VSLASAAGLQAGHSGRLCTHPLSDIRLSQAGVPPRTEQLIEQGELL